MMRRVENCEAEYKCEDLMVTFRDKTGIHVVEVAAGGLLEVEIEVFREYGYTYVLSWNTQHPYVGLEKLLGRETIGSLSLGNREAIEQILGKQALGLAPMTMVKKLARYLGKQEAQRE